MMHNKPPLHSLKHLALVILAGALLYMSIIAVAFAQEAKWGIPGGKGSYSDLVVLFDEFLAFRDSVNGSADFDTDAVATRRERMQQFQARIDDMNVASWDRAQQVDYLAVRSRLDQYEFTLLRSRPWARDPGFYVDKMLWVTFTELPVAGAHAIRSWTAQRDTRAGRCSEGPTR